MMAPQLPTVGAVPVWPRTAIHDTVAAIVGAAVGALHGREGLPIRWIDGLLGRTREDDDGRIFALIEAARRRWD